VKGGGDRPRHPWWIGLAARALIWVLNILMATLRVRVGAGGEHWDRLLESSQPVIFAFWHNRLVVCGELIQRRQIRAGRPVALLTSLSRDGELAARMAGMRGYRTIRGSTSRGGLGSLLRMNRAMRAGSSAATAPDGPRGPAQVVQPGTVMLAKLAGAPIVPLAYAASRSWRVSSWDRLVVPKPFARAVVTVGAPIEVAADPTDDELDVVSAELERRLNELVAQAEELL
jgi:lysophospholipid acyltransferase (LPLAT)-like uncharacterized protein